MCEGKLLYDNTSHPDVLRHQNVLFSSVMSPCPCGRKHLVSEVGSYGESIVCKKLDASKCTNEKIVNDFCDIYVYSII